MYERVLADVPQQPDALNLLGMIDFARGDVPLALNRIRQAIAINPQVPGFHTNLGMVLHTTGDSEAAAGAFRQALALKPDHLPALYNLGLALQALGDLEGATRVYSTALRLNPRLRDVWNSLGHCQAKLGDSHAALQSFQQAMRADPHFAPAQVNAAGVLMTMGRLEEAERMFRALLSKDPRQAEAHNNYGLLLMKASRIEEAASAFRAALAIRPDYDDAALNLGHALFERGDRDGALAQYRALIARAPDHAAAQLALAVAAIPIMTMSPAQSEQVPQAFMQAVDALDDWSRTHSGALARVAGSVQPFLLAYRPGDATDALRRFGALIHREVAQDPSAASVQSVATIGRARMRLGIVSGQVRTHPVWQIILRGMIERIDRDRFDVRLYATGQLQDAETQWAEAHVDHCLRQPLAVDAWTDHIRREAPDILFYPEVGMDAIGGALAPRRLAPRQLASWGHPITTGLPSIDIYLSGEAIEASDAQAHYSETLVKLPGTGVFTRFDLPPPRRWSGPPREPGHVRFALCQQPMKFDPQDDARIAQIARDAGPAEFWIVQSHKHPSASALLMERLGRAFAAMGLDPKRYLRITGWMNQAEFLGFLDAMDVMLDCPAFSGYTTAWQAIHRGTPIVTLEGRFMRQRLAAGLLRQIGQTGGVARDTDQYVQLAVEYAGRSRNALSRIEDHRSLAEAAPRADGNAAAIAAMQRLFLAS
ncbi:O-linked N-acetylglucosamine transferase, SPINDLY family protein [Sphingomonas sp. ASY06-1R]|uniref:O-linked N-acetylglucosamine transferase, SPINDLY family protein n=1 Tax=Sphingomonas sp. ASY06-1R TaxID=3445771 RepID=UPI003FA2C07E